VTKPSDGVVTGRALDPAVRALRDGAVVALPTDTVYGIGALAGDRAATARIFALKAREEHVALPVLVASVDDAHELVDGSPQSLGAFAALAAAFWPGALTIVMRRRPGLDFALGGDEATIGVRCPASPVARALLERVGPMAVTSANRSGEPPAVTAGEVAEIFGDRVVIVDGGRCDAPPSTVVALVDGAPVIVRPGPVTAADIDAVVRRQ
jgi:L-threonylcarbamoyladenylate synthase